MRKLLASFVLTFALSPALTPILSQTAQPTTKAKPNQNGAQESYWDKVLKPDVLPVWIGGTAAILASIAGLVTLGLLWEQSGLATRTLISTFPPKLRIRSMHLDVSKALSKTESVAVWKLVIANIGSSIGHIQPFKITFDSLLQDEGKETIYLLGHENIEAFSLNAGDIKTLDSQITNARDHVLVGKNFSDTSAGQYLWIRCTAVIIFVDDLSIERRIGFRRKFDAKTEKLIPDDDAEYEFDDET